MRVKLVFKNIALMCFLLFIGQANSFLLNLIQYLCLPLLQPWENPVFTPASGLYLNTPSALNPKVSYDAETGNYIIEQSIGNYQLSNPSYLSFEEFKEYNIQQGIRDYWRSKTARKSSHQKILTQDH